MTATNSNTQTENTGLLRRLSSDSSAKTGYLIHISDILSEVQEWALKDDQGITLNESTLTSENRTQLRRAGSTCGSWEILYIIMGAPILLGVVKNIIHPFFATQVPSGLSVFLLIIFVLFNYPVINFFLCTLSLHRIRGPMSRKILEIFLVTRGCFIMVFSFVSCVFFYWFIPVFYRAVLSSDLSAAYWFLSQFGDIFYYCCYISRESIKYIIIVSLITSLIPILLLYVNKLMRSHRRIFIDEFGLSRENITL